MSIYIGKTPISSVRTSVATTTSNVPISLSINSDALENFIRFQNFRIGQFRDVTGTRFQLYHSNNILLNYNSNQLQHIPYTVFQQNIAIQSNLIVASNVNVQQIASCNLVLQMAYGIPFHIEDRNAQTIYQIGLDKTMYFSSNLGIGIFSSNALEVLGDMRVQSNITIRQSLSTSKVITNTIYGNDQVSSQIDFNETNIHLIADKTIINNPNLKGLITYDGIIQLDETTINHLETSNLKVFNNLDNLPALYIKQLNPTNFANTATGNPLHIESYFSSTNKNVPIFIVDTLGRISAGKTSASIPEPDYGYSYHIDASRYPYLSGFLQLTSCNIPQMMIDKRGYISIGSNQTNHPLQIVYEPSTSKPAIKSLIGLYQTTSNQYAYIQSYDSNNVVKFHITDTGKVLFQQDASYNSDYLLEVQKRAYIRTIETSNIKSSSFIDFMNSSLSNVEHVDTNYLYTNSGLMSNVFMYNLTVNGLDIDAFDYISKAPNYEEFRIIPDRFLFYGSNIVMNPNPYFFETEQPDLPNDNLRIYANAGPSKSINVIKTIGNNQLSQVRIANCNNAVNSVSRTTLIANGEGFTFGVINLSTTPNGQAEAFITNNSDLTARNRQLSINPDGIRVGEKIHLMKNNNLTIGFTTPSKRTLTVVGEAEIKTNAGNTSLFVNQFGNVGFGTNNPRTGLEIKASTVYIAGNLGIGTITPQYPVDVIGTMRATRVLGGLFDDIIGGSFSNITPWTYTTTSNIYYVLGNVGIGTQNPISLLHLHSCNMETRQMIEVQGYYTGSWPPVPKASTQIVTSNVLAIQTSNILTSFMPVYPSDYMTTNTTTVSSKLYGNGIYTVKSSSTESGYPAYQTFDNSTSTYWVSDSANIYRYNNTSGAYEGNTILGGISGEWIQMFSPNTFILRQYIISGPTRESGLDSSYDIVSPRDWILLGSNISFEGWNILHTVINGYVGTSNYTNIYHLNQDISYNVYAIVITKANASTRTYGQIGIANINFYEGSNQRFVPISYSNYQLIGNTSNIVTITKDNSFYQTGSYEVSMTSNYTQSPYLDLQYTFNTSSIPYTVTSTPISYIRQSSLDGIFNDQSTTSFITLSNAFINSQDVNIPLSLLFTYPQVTTPILQYSIVGPSVSSYAPSKWTVSGSSDNISWTLLDTRSNITWTPNETKTYTFASPSTYSYYRYDFYRNNTATYGPLSIQRILTYGTFHTDTSLMNYTTYPSIYNTPPASNLSQWNISGGLVIGSNYAIQNQNPTNQSILIENAIGIGTYNPKSRLHIEGVMRIIGNTSNEGRLYVGTTIGSNTGSVIHFGKTNGDISYDDTVIESYVRSGSYPTELLIFKGSNSISPTGPDRIRLRAGEIHFDVYSNDTLDRSIENTQMIIKTNGCVELSIPLVTSNLSTTTLTSLNSGIAAFKQYSYFSSSNYTLPSLPEYGCSYARIQMWGAGGGGAGGNMQGTINSAGTILGGAGGGGAGAYGEVIIPYELLFNTTLTATIGTGGAGGTAGSIGTTITTTTTSTNATSGTSGTSTTFTLTTNSSSSFSYTWAVNGGEGGKVSTTTAAGNLGAGGYPVSTTTFNSSQKGGDGGLGGTTSAGGGNGGTLIGNGYAATGGGGGAGQPATNTTTALYYSGGNSGSGAKIASYLVGSTAFAYGEKYTTSGTLIKVGESGYSITNTYTGGTGGGGGYGNTGNTGSGNIGSGLFGYAGGYPGGGGGGGASGKTIVPNTSTIVNGNGGFGGAGADGGLILTYY
uniref:Uncharacterized protein n=1 Tax=viral metagenome TaxID=1070528 RepID=A0A6C0CU46_9ZZZZ